MSNELLIKKGTFCCKDSHLSVTSIQWPHQKNPIPKPNVHYWFFFYLLADDRVNVRRLRGKLGCWPDDEVSVQKELSNAILQQNQCLAWPYSLPAIGRPEIGLEVATTMKRETCKWWTNFKKSIDMSTFISWMEWKEVLSIYHLPVARLRINEWRKHSSCLQVHGSG